MTADPFDTLGLPPSFDLQAAEIGRAYLARVARMHPDIAAADDVATRSADLNQARAVLLDPELRAVALLARLGGPTAEQDRSLAQTFLAEMMEVREECEAAISSGDPEAVARWRGWAAARRAEFIAEVSKQFRAIGAAPGDPGLRELRRTLNAWRYIERMIQQLDEPDRRPGENGTDR